MDQQYFLNNYIGKFNQQDHSGFEEFFAPNIKMFNGGLIFEGVEAVKEHYRQIWSVMKETLNVKEY
ncbi:nuclear transport factor 2 family protein, partial [Acinetobacter nosocomialis]